MEKKQAKKYANSFGFCIANASGAREKNPTPFKCKYALKN